MKMTHYLLLLLLPVLAACKPSPAPADEATVNKDGTPNASNASNAR